LILSFIKGELPPAIGLKIIPSLFDLLSAFSIYKIARLKFKSDMSFLLAAGFFTLPTMVLNSSGWGQVDSMYGSLLLLCLYLLTTERPFPALAVYGLAFSFKLQAIFLLPFLGILFLRKKIHWYHFLVLPAVYVLTMLPAFLAGRSWQSIIQVYTGQATQYENLARYAPNLYFLIPIDYFHPVFEIGMGTFFVCMLAWAWVNWRAKPPVTQHQLVLTALASAALVPFLLPKMLDRYFYPADLFSFVAAIFIPQLWFVPLFFQLSSGLAYTIFMFGMPPLMALPGALINTALVVIIIRQQLTSLKTPQGDIHAGPDE
jgi:Gpi18-like mannosyltransferase